MISENKIEAQTTNLQLQIRQLYIDFLDPALVFRIIHNSGKKQLIGKAVGIKSNYKPFVIDATAGLGTDALILACLGCKVHMIERSPIIGALLQDGLERLKKAHQEKNLSFIPINFSLRLSIADSIDYIKNYSNNRKPEVIYLDPMYPERKKSALGKQKMRLIKNIVGEDRDAHKLLQHALKLATNRVVVKRPRLADSLAYCKQPTISFKGNSSRYDVYITSI